MFREIRRNEKLREDDERNRRSLVEFNPDARIQPRVTDQIATEMALNSLTTNKLQFNPDARIIV